MNNEYKLTILTPTYNRVNYLPRLYESLKTQTNIDFQWVVIDDGSTDDTDNYLKQIELENSLFDFEHYRKENGGKHTALNYSHQYIKGDWVCIVDSDDWLMPDSVSKILTAIEKYERLDNVKVITFLKANSNKEPLVSDFPITPTMSNHIDFRVNGKRRGDCCEIIKADILKEHPFPVFNGEKFMGEGYLWNYTGFHYDTIYINDAIYLCEYLNNGLSKSGRLLRIKSPYGGMANSNSFFQRYSQRKVNFGVLVKEAILFVCYGKFAGLSAAEIIKRCHNQTYAFLFYIFGYALFLFWKHKYM